MANKQFLVFLPNGFSINKYLLRYLYDRLKALKSEEGLRFLELVHLARDPSYKLSEASLKNLFHRGLLGNPNFLHFENQMAILFLVEGIGRSANIISLEQLESIISSNTS